MLDFSNGLFNVMGLETGVFNGIDC